jgi:inhibitor of KinA sporulation pathway (predicted exonuclease)
MEDLTTNAETIICLDFEFACWPDSLNTQWRDPSRPPEVIEAGAIAIHIDAAKPFLSFSSLVRPGINPQISEYCRSLTGISQDEIHAAPPLATVAERLAKWLDGLAPRPIFACTWGPSSFDRLLFAGDCQRNGIRDPLGTLPNLDLRAYAERYPGCTWGSEPRREAVWSGLSLPDPNRRHRALDDAEDVARIFVALGQFQPFPLTEPAQTSGASIRDVDNRRPSG